MVLTFLGLDFCYTNAHVKVNSTYSMYARFSRLFFANHRGGSRIGPGNRIREEGLKLGFYEVSGLS